MTRSLVLAAAERRLRKTCGSLPAEAGDDFYREWAAELPAIIDDPDVRPAPLRWIFVWLFVLDQSRTVSRLQGSSLLNASRRLIQTLKVFRALVTVLVSQFAGAFVLGLQAGFNPFVAATVLTGGALLLGVVFRRLNSHRKRKRSKQ